MVESILRDRSTRRVWMVIGCFLITLLFSSVYSHDVISSKSFHVDTVKMDRAVIHTPGRIFKRRDGLILDALLHFGLLEMMHIYTYLDKYIIGSF